MPACLCGNTSNSRKACLQRVLSVYTAYLKPPIGSLKPLVIAFAMLSQPRIHRQTKMFNSRSNCAVSETSFQIAPFFIFMFLLFLFFAAYSSRPHASSFLARSLLSLTLACDFSRSSLGPRPHTDLLYPSPFRVRVQISRGKNQSVSQSVCLSVCVLAVYFFHVSVAHQHCPKQLDFLQTLTRCDEQLCAFRVP